MIVETTASDVCPDCGTDLEHHTAEQAALFIHGGYGATARTVISRCPACGWSLQREKSEIRPPRSEPTT